MSENNQIPYKYSCRKCPIRNRCVEESDNSPITKVAIRNAFINKTDTLELWGLLQVRCLLVKADQEAEAAGTESLLSQRLRSVREARVTNTNQLRASSPKGGAIIGAEEPTASPPPSPPARKRTSSLPATTSSLLDIPTEKPADIRDPGQFTKREIINARSAGQRYWLTVHSSGRHISLPIDGELVLGRFDPNFGIPPDVDLTFEDGRDSTVSRRHARILGQGGIHTIQEMGSRAGVVINGQPISMGAPYRLRDRDAITLGNCTMVYESVPSWLRNLDHTQSLYHELMLATTGQKIAVPRSVEWFIGRSDRFVNISPDIDLASLQAIAGKVSRKHARLSFIPGDPYLYIQDMGSGFGTKINGQVLMLSDSHALFPGDHISLGGCVLAYDVTLR